MRWGTWGIASLLVVVAACGSQPALPEPILVVPDWIVGPRVQALADSLVVTGVRNTWQGNLLLEESVAIELDHEGTLLDRGLPLVIHSLSSSGGWTAFYVRAEQTIGRRAPDGRIDSFALPLEWGDDSVSVIAGPDGTVWLDRSGMSYTIWKLADGALTPLPLDAQNVRIWHADASFLYTLESHSGSRSIVRYPVAGGPSETLLQAFFVQRFQLDSDHLVYAKISEIRSLSLSTREEVVVGVVPANQPIDVMAVSGDTVVAGPYRLQDGTSTLLLPEPRAEGTYGHAFTERIASVAAADGLVFWTIGNNPTRVYAYPVDGPPLAAPVAPSDEYPPFL